MARQMVVIDDITGEAGASERQFGTDGKVYRIDLTDEGYAELLELLAPYTENGEEAGRMLVDKQKPRRAPTISGDQGSHTPEEVASLRAWAATHDVQLPKGGGRIPARIWNAWRHNDPALAQPKERSSEGVQQRLDEAS